VPHYLEARTEAILWLYKSQRRPRTKLRGGGGDKLNKKHNQRRKTWTQTEERGRTEGDRTGNKTGKTDEKGRTQTSENWEAENTKKRWTEEESP
jgi:hypothetical protein